MKIRRPGHEGFASRNARYKQAARIVVQEFMQTESEGFVGYLHATEPPLQIAMPDAGQLVIGEASCPAAQENRFDLSGLGEYEKLLLTTLAWGEYTTYVLTGEMGSGKTAVLKLMKDIISKPNSSKCTLCQRCEPLVLYLNFNEGFNDNQINALIATFRRRLYDELRYELRRFLSKSRIVEDFLIYVADGHAQGLQKAFDRFVPSREAGATALGIADDILRFIDSSSDNHRDRLEILMAFLRFIRDRGRPDPGCLVLIYDNIDSVFAEAQYDILVDIFALQEIAKSRAVVALRRSTFEQLKNQAAYSFGVIPHRSPGLAPIIKARLERLVGEPSSIKQFSQLDEPHSQAILRRATYVLEHFEEERGPIATLRLFSGQSLRLGLNLGERLFLTDGVPWDENPSHIGDLVRGIVVAEGEGREMNLRDRGIVNIFADYDTGKLSLLPLRILQLVLEFRDRRELRSLQNIVGILRVIGDWTRDDIRIAANHLLSERRPLLWVDGRSNFDSINSMEGRDLLGLTMAGESYFKKFLFDLTYVQESLLALDWPADVVPTEYDYGSVVERFRILRLVLRALAQRDREEVARFVQWRERESARTDIGVILISNRIVASVIDAMVRILASYRDLDQPLVTGLSRDWLSFTLECLNQEAKNGRVSTRLVRAQKTLQKFIVRRASVRPEKEKTLLEK